MSPLGAVVFDLDGTLVDSRDDLATAVNGLRRELGLPALARDEVVANVGHGARDLVRRSLPGTIAGEEYERAFVHFSERYFEVCLAETRPYPGIHELLAELAGRFALAVLTNKPERPAQKILAGLGLDRHFALVLGGDSLAWKKPDGRTLVEASRRLGVAIAETALVGDSAVDAATAQAAGAPFVLVGWGFGKPEELAPFRPYAVASTAPEVAAALHARA